MGYPLMMYRGGVKLDDHRIVSNELQQVEAEKDGFALLDMAAVKGSESPRAMPDKVGAFIAAVVAGARADEPVKRGPGRPRKVPA